MESYERWEDPGNVGLDLQIFRQIESNTSLTQVADAATSSAYLSLWVELEGVGETRQEGGLHWQGNFRSVLDIAIRIRPLVLSWRASPPLGPIRSLWYY
ncbi:hypothetical protein DTO164E3_3544 [Paecilomyces variotii]|nr:hypothetical protein DTO164E3_3544 [Paecilomyces variotii]KAJ9223774.1 hypothetical protein DTO169C6_3888 [Paecilomyces variotii]KAJ9279871.1 hypothetical protein DTO021D3_3376 [Paecilomyces variotii]KAJ9347715.1 hypothetical protein DTO027B9_8938 [Paecilomyces variotii]